MICKVICYKDVKLGVFSHPIFVGNLSKEEIIEDTRRMCANPQMPSVYFDYDVYFLGEFDDKLGTFKTTDPEFLVSIADFKHLRSVEEVKTDAVS